MCKVLVKEPKKKIGFIVCNHLYQREKKDFTLSEIVEELGRYHVDVDESMMRSILGSYIENGRVYQTPGKYVYVGF